MLAGGVCRVSCHTPLLDKEVSGAGHVLLMMHLLLNFKKRFNT